MMPSFIKLLFSSFLSLTLLIIAFTSFHIGAEFQKTTEQVVEKYRLLDKLSVATKCGLDAIIPDILGYEGCKEEKASLEELINKQAELKFYQSSLYIAFLIIMVILFLYSFFSYEKRKIIVLHLLLVSMICLFIGIFSPFMQIIVYKEIDLLNKIVGNVVVEYFVKSIFTTIQSLFQSGNTLIALVTILFSIVMPVMKSLLMGVLAFADVGKANDAVVKFIKFIGPWSMAEVFVAAILISLFAIEKDELTNSSIHVGFLFFFAYVILSIMASHLLLKIKE